MATLTINGTPIKVDDSFLRLSPADQEKTVNEIAAQMGARPQQSASPVAGLQVAGPVAPNPAASNLPGVAGQLQNTSRAFQSGAMQGMTLGWGDELNAGLMTPIEMGIDAFQGKGFDPGRSFNQALAKNRALDQGNAALNPVANITGEITGAMLSPGKGGTLAKNALAGAIYGAGSSDGDLKDRAINAVNGGVTGAVVGAAIPAVAKAGGSVVRDFLQNRLTSTAIKGAPTAQQLKDAGSALFDSATGGSDAPAVSETAFGRFLGNVVNAVTKYRPNPNNDPQATGLLSHLVQLGKAAQTGSGAVVDLKDLHLTRQLAQKVGQSSSGRDAAIGNIVVKQIDDFVKSLKPADILGGGDPRQAASDLMNGISTWARAQKVSLIQNALSAADTYKSGFENGLKLSFLKLMRSSDFARFSPMEQDAIRRVAKGTTMQNIAELIGKMGFSFGGGAAHNVIGGSIGTTTLAGMLAPMGPLAIPTALAATTAAGAAGRAVAERLATSGANRAARIVATPVIPRVALPTMPQIPGAPFAFPIIDQTRRPLAITIRGGSASPNS